MRESWSDSENATRLQQHDQTPQNPFPRHHQRSPTPSSNLRQPPPLLRRLRHRLFISRSPPLPTFRFESIDDRLELPPPRLLLIANSSLFPPLLQPNAPPLHTPRHLHFQFRPEGVRENSVGSEMSGDSRFGYPLRFSHRQHRLHRSLSVLLCDRRR